MLSSTLNLARFRFLNMTTLSERIQTVMDEQQLDQAALAAVAGCSKSWVNQWLSGLGKSIAYKYARSIHARYGYAIDWLTTGAGPKMTLAVREPAPSLNHEVDAQEIPFSGDEHPVVGYVMGGDRGYYDELAYATGHGEGYVRYPTRDRNTYALRVRGDSMRPRLQPGEYVVVAPNHQVAPGDEVVVKTTDGRVLVKKLGARRSGLVELQSVNETDHPPISLEETEILFMHYVAGVAKDYLYRSAM